MVTADLIVLAWTFAASPTSLEREGTRPSSVVHTAPALTELRAIPAGRDLAISWSTAGTIDEVDLEQSADGETFELIAVASPNMGRFDWSPPTGFTGVIRVRATSGAAMATVRCGAPVRGAEENRDIVARILDLILLLRT